MGEFSRKEHCAGRIGEDGYPRRPAARIKLDTQWLDTRSRNSVLYDDREREAPKDGCPSLLEQPTCIPWMDRVQWLLVGIEYKDL